MGSPVCHVIVMSDEVSPVCPGFRMDGGGDRWW